MPSAVYLDYNATAPVRPAVREAVAEALGVTGNASSVHGFGRAARRLIEDAREAVACLAAASPSDVVFTSGGTEANSLALGGAGRKRVLVSAVEHPSVLEALPDAERIPVDANGVVELEALDRLLARSAEPALVSVMAANNETGVLQPISEVVRIARAAGALVHCDAVQAAGRLPLEMINGADMVSLSAHKIGGPQGVGALIVRGEIAASLRGGGQERRRRAGTENLPGIAGFGVSAAEACKEVEQSNGIARLRDGLEQRIMAAAPSVHVFGHTAERLTNTTCFALPGFAAETQVMALDLAGIAISAGSACSSGKVGASHVLLAMGVSEADARCAIRVSLGRESKPADVDRFVEAWTALAARSRRVAVAA
jgi:cysteine desulfurase